ncbi:MAG: hypothetical protein K8R23_12335 [Chthoniobacter sp.]|nr:hypothetical protein [Chthoniobacter sp.]
MPDATRYDMNPATDSQTRNGHASNGNGHPNRQPRHGHGYSHAANGNTNGHARNGEA